MIADSIPLAQTVSPTAQMTLDERDAASKHLRPAAPDSSGFLMPKTKSKVNRSGTGGTFAAQTSESAANGRSTTWLYLNILLKLRFRNRHGVRMKSDGKGTVEIKTAELSECYKISVRDDCPGFDPSAPPTDGKPHIGLRNVQDRLQRQGGTLRIESEPGCGSTVTIRIPKTAQEESPC